MSEKKVSGIRSDLSPSEFKKNLAPPTARMKRAKTWAKVKKVLDFMGIINSSDSKGMASRANGSGVHVVHHQSNTEAFRESQRFDPEKAYIVRMQEKAYMDMVDGRGDSDCHCDHDER